MAARCAGPVDVKQDHIIPQHLWWLVWGVCADMLYFILPKSGVVRLDYPKDIVQEFQTVNHSYFICCGYKWDFIIIIMKETFLHKYREQVCLTCYVVARQHDDVIISYKDNLTSCLYIF